MSCGEGVVTVVVGVVPLCINTLKSMHVQCVLIYFDTMGILYPAGIQI